MTRQVLTHSTPVNRRQPFLPNHHPVALPAGPGRGGRNRVSEAAGKTAADCAAVCCCCPCTVMNILVLAVYKVPAGLCRKASMRKRQRALAKKKRAGSLCAKPAGAGGGAGLAAGAMSPDMVDCAAEDSVADLLKKGEADGGDDAAADDLEREMWTRFHDAGFWRSPSMRDM